MDAARFLVDGADYAYRAQGEGPAVLLLHGWPVTSYHFRQTVPALVTAGRRAIAVDLLGLGQSRHTSGTFEKRRIAQDLVMLMARLEPPPARYAVVGHDWGGSVALAMAALDPERVSHLIVEEEIPPGLPADITAPGNAHYPTWHGGFHRVPALAEQLLAGREDAYISYFLDLRAIPLCDLDREVYLASYRSAAATRAGLGYYRTPREDATFFRSLRLAVPCLTIGGRFAMGDAVGQSLREAVPASQHLTLEACGHYPAEEQPDAFNQAILDAIEEDRADDCE